MRVCNVEDPSLATMEALRQSCASRKSRVMAGLVSGGLIVLALAAAVVMLATLTADHRRAVRHEMLAAEEGRVRASGVNGAAVGGAAVPAAALAGGAPMARVAAVRAARPIAPDAVVAEGETLECNVNYKLHHLEQFSMPV